MWRVFHALTPLEIASHSKTVSKNCDVIKGCVDIDGDVPEESEDGPVLEDACGASDDSDADTADLRLGNSMEASTDGGPVLGNSQDALTDWPTWSGGRIWCHRTENGADNLRPLGGGRTNDLRLSFVPRFKQVRMPL